MGCSPSSINGFFLGIDEQMYAVRCEEIEEAYMHANTTAFPGSQQNGGGEEPPPEEAYKLKLQHEFGHNFKSGR